MLGPAGQRMSYGDAAGQGLAVASRRCDAPSARARPSRRSSAPPIRASTSPPRCSAEQVFIHDLRPAGMLFGAVARPPAYAARLALRRSRRHQGHARRGRGGARRLVPGRGGAARGAGAGRRQRARQVGQVGRRRAAVRRQGHLRLPADGRVRDGGAAHREGRCAAGCTSHTRPSTAATSRPTPRSGRAARWRSGRTASSRCGRTRRGRSRCAATSPRP